jgi:hypothetical protein
LVDRGATRSLALRRSIKLLRHEFAVPAQNRVGLDNHSDFFQGLLAQLLANVRQGLALAVTQPETPLHKPRHNFVYANAEFSRLAGMV